MQLCRELLAHSCHFVAVVVGSHQTTAIIVNDCRISICAGYERCRWAMREGSSRLMLLFRFEPQYTGTVPQKLPPLVDARLSDETKELMSYAHISHTKAVAAEWRSTFRRSHVPRL